MDTTNGLVKRIDRLEQRWPATASHTCAEWPVFTMGGDARPCPGCGLQPITFTIDIDSASGREGDAA